MGQVLDLPKYILSGSLEGLRRPGAKPPERPAGMYHDPCSTTSSPTPARRATAGTRSLLDAMRRAIPRTTKRASTAASRDETDPEPDSPRTRVTAPFSRPHLARARGSPAAADVTPQGGYKSHLPDDDDLPAALDPDPCKDPRRSPICRASSSARRSRSSSASDRRLPPDHVADDRLLVRLERRAPAHRQTVPRHRHLRGRLRPVRLEARLHRPLRGRAVLRARRQRHRRRDEGGRRRQRATRSRRTIEKRPHERRLPGHGLARAESRPLHGAPHPADRNELRPRTNHRRRGLHRHRDADHGRPREEERRLPS